MSSAGKLIAFSALRRLRTQGPSSVSAVLREPARGVTQHARPSTPQDRPWWLPAYRRPPGGEHQQDAVKHQAVTKDAATPVGSLPPWPVDEIEFNALLPDGGHDKRIAHELYQQQQPQQRQESDGSSAPTASVGSADVFGDDQSHVPFPLTVAQAEAVQKVETTTDEGRDALARGGWVCAKCLRATPYRSRSICEGCHTLRHDAQNAVRGWRADPGNWICGLCHEFNFPHDDRCRCCATTRSACKEVRVMHHDRVADEVRNAAVGSVVNVRNRVCRWQCCACGEINSLKCSECRRCGGERFSMTVSCPSCKSPQPLSNKLMYGDEVQDGKHYTQVFGAHNFFPRLSPTRTCTHCRSPLHGAPVTSLPRSSWLCACGNVNAGVQLSCMRCRLPRSIPNATTLRRLLSQTTARSSPPLPSSASLPCQTGASAPLSPSSSVHNSREESGLSRLRPWDFAGCTNWLCESCEEGSVNAASRFVVTLVSPLTADTPSARVQYGGQILSGGHSPQQRNGASRIARMVHGDSHCCRCGMPWHHEVLRENGQCWRCACHAINQKDSSKCTSCGLPAVDGIRVDVLSQWTRGDWLCEACGRHNYRDRVQCMCGQARPTAAR